MCAEVVASAELIQLLWVLLCAALVLFMQAGFCCLEAGAVREKNSINVAVKNVVDLCVSLPAFFLVGYALMFGRDLYFLIGEPVLFLSNLGAEELPRFLYQAAFCATAATIVSGAVAERCRFLPYLLVSAGVSFLIYPLFGHWVWGGGFLAQLGYHDFAGSSVVHILGAGVAFAGIQEIGAREGRFGTDGPRKIPGSSMPMVALGVMILLLGWIGFNGGSAPLGAQTPTILFNTILAACFGGLSAMLLGWALRGLPDVDEILQGLLGGLVAITACADVIAIQASAGVGLLGGAAVVLGSALLERYELDDPVGAVPVHGFAGAMGIVLTGVLAGPELLKQTGWTRLQLVGVQVFGLLVCASWSYIAGYLLWYWVGRLTDLRVDTLAERIGMNFSEHRHPVAPAPVAAASATNSVALGGATHDAR